MSRILLTFAFVFALSAPQIHAIGRGPTPAPVKSKKVGRLIVQRSPSFGSNRVVRLSIDGRKVADIPRNRHYGDLISAGRHSLSVRALPHAGSRPTSIRITVKSGKLYIYTVGWSSDRIVLQPSTFYSHTPRVN